MGTLITGLNEDSARGLVFELFLLLFSLNIISKSYQSAYHDGQLTQQAVPPLHSVALHESAQSRRSWFDNSVCTISLKPGKVWRYVKFVFVCHSWIVELYADFENRVTSSRILSRISVFVQNIYTCTYICIYARGLLCNSLWTRTSSGKIVLPL